MLEREAEIRAAGDSLAARLSRPDTEVYRIEVQPGPQPGAIADAYPTYLPNSLTPHAGVIRFETGRGWDSQFSLPAVVWHELGHAIGILEHNPDPNSLMRAFAPPAGTTPDVTYSDLPLFERAGWDVIPLTPHPLELGLVKVVGVGVQDGDGEPDGFAYMTPEEAAEVYPYHVPRPDPDGRDSWVLSL